MEGPFLIERVLRLWVGTVVGLGARGIGTGSGAVRAKTRVAFVIRRVFSAFH
jgi:hypothetical protein